MNERIDELLQQARDFINEVSDADGVYQGKEYPQAVREKFAELIVRECADQCTTDGPFGAEVVWGKQFHDKIKKHFGVE